MKSASGIAVSGKYIHWGDVLGTIGRASLDGSGVSGSFNRGAAVPLDVAIAP